jgi:hypothetical protein
MGLQLLRDIWLSNVTSTAVLLKAFSVFLRWEYIYKINEKLT